MSEAGTNVYKSPTMELQWNPIVSIFLARKRTYFVETPVTLNELGALRERL